MLDNGYHYEYVHNKMYTAYTRRIHPIAYIANRSITNTHIQKIREVRASIKKHHSENEMIESTIFNLIYIVRVDFSHIRC